MLCGDDEAMAVRREEWVAARSADRRTTLPARGRQSAVINLCLHVRDVACVMCVLSLLPRTRGSRRCLEVGLGVLVCYETQLESACSAPSSSSVARQRSYDGASEHARPAPACTQSLRAAQLSAQTCASV